MVFSDFGGIFGELLPGNFAKLQPPEGKDLMDGLEVKVRLGATWKQSLTELSGGQRCIRFHNFRLFWSRVNLLNFQPLHSHSSLNAGP